MPPRIRLSSANFPPLLSSLTRCRTMMNVFFKENVVMLGLLTGTSPEFRMTLQTRHDLWHANRKVWKRLGSIRRPLGLSKTQGLRRSQTH